MVGSAFGIGNDLVYIERHKYTLIDGYIQMYEI